MAFLSLRQNQAQRRWVAERFTSYDPSQDTYLSARHRVGASPEELAAQAQAKADVYTYGATSAALSEGQAMLAWAELSKQQNYPKIQSVAASWSVPPGFLFAPDGKTGVNRDNVHVALGNDCGAPYKGGIAPGWSFCAALPSYLRLNEDSALRSGSLPKVADAVLRGLRAMRMTTTDYGWTGVKSQLRAVAWQLATAPAYGLTDKYGKGSAPGDDENVDELAFELEATIGPLYDKDQANKLEGVAKSDAQIASLLKSSFGKTAGASSTSMRPSLVTLGLLGGGAALLYFYHPAAALGALGLVWRGAKSATGYVYGKAKGAIT